MVPRVMLPIGVGSVSVTVTVPVVAFVPAVLETVRTYVPDPP
jgi:hypothetical protein